MDGAEQPETETTEESIGDLVGRLAENGRAYAEAELEVIKAIARHRAARARKGAILVAVGATLLLSALTALVLGLVLGLAQLIHPALAGLAVCLVLAAIGGVLAWSGVGGLAALGGDEEERQALARAERTP